MFYKNISKDVKKTIRRKSDSKRLKENEKNEDFRQKAEHFKP